MSLHSVTDPLLNRDIRLTIVAEGEHGARITATYLGTDATAEDAIVPRVS